MQAAGRLISVATEAGRFVSTDGRVWRLGDPDVLAARPHFSIERSFTWPRSTLVAHHGSRTFRFSGRAAGETDAVADSRHAYALVSGQSTCESDWTLMLLVTSDGGRTWLRRHVPFGLSSLAADGSRVAAVGRSAGCANVLVLSSDYARTWRVRRLPQWGCVVSMARDDLWLACGRKLLVSRDRGARWTELGTPRRFDSAHVAAAGQGAAWGLAWRGSGRERLFRTADGGRTWAEQWPHLPTP